MVERGIEGVDFRLVFRESYGLLYGKEIFRLT